MTRQIEEIEMTKKYDVIIIGAGPGGYVAALKLSRLKKRVALVESRKLGGTCLNVGCIPTKALLHSSRIAAELKDADQHGIVIDHWKIDLSKMMKRKNDLVNKMRHGVTQLLKNGKFDTYFGRGTLLDAHRVAVWEGQTQSHVLDTEHIIIACGTEPTIPSVFPQNRDKVLTSDEILNLQELPQSLLIVGGGIIGCEFATFFAELGTRVVIVELLDRLLPMADKDISRALLRRFKSMGIETHLSAKIEQMAETASGVTTRLGNNKTFESSLALVCTGRRPLSADLGLEQAGIKTDNGFITIDAGCRTSTENVFAIGDITGKLQLAHVAYRQAEVAANLICSKEDSEDYQVIPAAVYTHPEIAWVGLTEEQAIKEGIQIRKSKVPMSASGLAQAYSQTDGLVKLISDQDDTIIGAHLMCPHASDVIQEVAVLMKSECTFAELAATIHGHPTFSESLIEATGILLGNGGH